MSYTDADKLTACQCYVDHVMKGCEGLGACGSLMFSDDKRIELHNELLKVFGLKPEDKDLICPITDNLSILRPSAIELKYLIEKVIKDELSKDS